VAWVNTALRDAKAERLSDAEVKEHNIKRQR